MAGPYMTMPGARLYIGPAGHLVESMGSTPDADPSAELSSMKKGLRRWLKFWTINEEFRTGKRTLKPGGLMPRRDMASEAQLAAKIHRLLTEAGDTNLPSLQDPYAAAKLAKRALGEVSGPQAQGILPLVPLLVVVGGSLAFLAYVVKIRTAAEKEAELERIKAEAAGAGRWGPMKVLGAVLVGWFLWEKAGIGARVRHEVSTRGRK
ncbi:MAG: hypothetical protein R3322_00295 [Kiloniellales bacterium]|nr:hypothetical protein [Kiloniellales bacterium]